MAGRTTPWNCRSSSRATSQHPSTSSLVVRLAMHAVSHQHGCTPPSKYARIKNILQASRLPQPVAYSLREFERRVQRVHRFGLAIDVNDQIHHRRLAVQRPCRLLLTIKYSASDSMTIYLLQRFIQFLPLLVLTSRTHSLLSKYALTWSRGQRGARSAPLHRVDKWVHARKKKAWMTGRQPDLPAPSSALLLSGWRLSSSSIRRVRFLWILPQSHWSGSA